MWCVRKCWRCNMCVCDREWWRARLQEQYANYIVKSCIVYSNGVPNNVDSIIASFLRPMPVKTTNKTKMKSMRVCVRFHFHSFSPSISFGGIECLLSNCRATNNNYNHRWAMKHARFVFVVFFFRFSKPVKPHVINDNNRPARHRHHQCVVPLFTSGHHTTRTFSKRNRLLKSEETTTEKTKKRISHFIFLCKHSSANTTAERK